MALVLRNTKGSALTYNELDGNFTFITSSFVQNSLTSSMTAGTASYVTTLSDQPVSINGAAFADQDLKLAAGSITLSSGTGTSPANPALAGKILGSTIFIVASYYGASGGSPLNVTIAGNGAITVNELGGTSNETINFIATYY